MKGDVALCLDYVRFPIHNMNRTISTIQIFCTVILSGYYLLQSINEPPREKTNNLHIRKRRRRSDSR